MQSLPKIVMAGLIGAAALSWVVPQPISAHAGGLAADGCHNDRKNGGRNCHRGGSGDSSASRQPSRLLGSNGGGDRSITRTVPPLARPEPLRSFAANRGTPPSRPR